MWIDTERLRVDDFSPHEQFDESELCSPEEQARLERVDEEREKEEWAYREAMEAEQAAIKPIEMDYPF